MKVSVAIKDFPTKLGALQSLATKKLPPYPTAYRVGKALAAMQSEERHLQLMHANLVKKYGELDESKQNWKVKPENTDEFNAEFNPILESEVELEIPTIDVTDLGKEPIEPVVISSLIDWFIYDRSNNDAANT